MLKRTPYIPSPNISFVLIEYVPHNTYASYLHALFLCVFLIFLNSGWFTERVINIPYGCFIGLETMNISNQSDPSQEHGQKDNKPRSFRIITLSSKRQLTDGFLDHPHSSWIRLGKYWNTLHILPLVSTQIEVVGILPRNTQEHVHRQFSNIRRTQSQYINVSRLALLLSLPDPLKLARC